MTNSLSVSSDEEKVLIPVFILIALFLFLLSISSHALIKKNIGITDKDLKNHENLLQMSILRPVLAPLNMLLVLSVAATKKDTNNNSKTHKGDKSN